MPMVVSGTRARRAVAAAVAVGAAVAVVATVAAAHSESISSPSTKPRAAGASAPAVAAVSPATAKPCPRGNEPVLNIKYARFVPDLVNGTTLRPGTYRIVLTGSVVNETSATIKVSGLRPEVGGAPWQAHVSAPATVAPWSAGDVTIEGTYSTRHTEQASAGAHLSWAWADVQLVGCGIRGLTTED